MDFSISLTPNTAIISGTLIISTSAIWTTTTIVYIVSARDDFRVGSFTADITSLMAISDNNTILTLNNQLVKPWNGNRGKVYAFPFISGIKTSSN